MTAILTSDFTTIEVGQSITFTVTIPLSDIPLPTISEYVGGYAFFYSGDGQMINPPVGPLSIGPVTFTYLTPGSYVAQASGMEGYHSMYCEPNGVCTGLANGGLGPGSQVFNLFESITVVPDPPGFVPAPFSAVPEPATWALMLLGFGFLMWRIKWRL
jgi:hypothetical protein